MDANETVEPERMLDHARWIRRLAHGLIADPADAEDVAQDTWVAALRHPPQAGRPVRPWLRRVLGNFARQRTRADRNRVAREERAARVEAQPSVEELVLRAEHQRSLVERVLELREPYRATILLRFYEGLEPVQIAGMQGVPAATVRSRIRRGLTLLRAELDARNGGRREVWVGAFAPLLAPALPVGVEPSNLTTGVETMITGTKIAAAVAGTLLTGAVAWQVVRVLGGGNELAPGSGSEILATPERPAPLAADEPAPLQETASGLAQARTPSESRAPVATAPTAPVGGTLLDASTGQPLADYTLRVEHAAGRTETVETDDLGRFVTQGALAAGDVTLHLVDHPANGVRLVTTREMEKKKLMAKLRQREPTANREVEEKMRLVELKEAAARKERGVAETSLAELVLIHIPDDARPHELSVPTGPTWFFTIDNPHQADLTGATAFLRQSEWREPGNAAWTALRDGARPWVRFDDVVVVHMSPRGLALDVRDSSGLFAGSIRVEATSGVQERRVEIGERTRLKGRLITADEAPVAGLQIVMRAAGEEHAEIRARAGLAIAFWTTTDDDGRFDLAWIPPGEYTLYTVIDGHEDLGRPLALEAGLVSQSFVVDAIDQRTDLIGRVTSLSGTTEDHIRIQLTALEPDEVDDPHVGEERGAKMERVHWKYKPGTDAVGHFAFGALPPGTYRLSASTQSFLPLEPETITITLPSDEVPEFVFQDDTPRRTLSFQATPGEDGDIREFIVRFVLDPGSEHPRFRGAETGKGRPATIPDVPLGTDFEWRVHAPSWQPVWGDQDDFARADELELELRKGWGTAFMVRGPDKAPLVGTEIYLDGRLVGTTDAKGQLRVSVPEQPEQVRLVHKESGAVLYVEEAHELREFTPTISVVMEEDSGEPRTRRHRD